MHIRRAGRSTSATCGRAGHSALAIKRAVALAAAAARTVGSTTPPPPSPPPLPLLGRAHMLTTRLYAPARHGLRAVRSQAATGAAPLVPPCLLTAPPRAASPHHDTLASGKLLDDGTVTSLLRGRLAQPDVRQNGYILDGYPRTPEQAKLLLDVEQRPTLAIQLHLHEHTLRSRLLARRLYSHRADDDPAVIEKRLSIYERHADEICDVLVGGEIPVQVVHDDGSGIESVFESVRHAMGVERRVLLMGAPGCGKGTQGELLSAATSAVHVSTGDLLRANYSAPALP
ncbi:adenylate kinase [Gracilaria domingensis]|nr:adenylate kinase [Gracilaria domingensis]